MREFRRKTHRFGTPELDASPKSDHTFQSVYGYPQDTVNKILSQGHTRDLKGLPVYSDYLYIDVDQDDNVDIVRQKLRVLGIKIMEYTTGNRGIHFHIPITRMEGTDVVYSQKVWLREKELWDLIDTSFYHEGGQFRLRGAIHSKTGRRKQLTWVWEGDILEIPTRKTPPPVYVKQEEGSPSAKREYFINLASPRSEGGRHMHMFILWKRGLKAGYSPEEIESHIRMWNETMADPPHDERLVTKKLRGFKC